MDGETDNRDFDLSLPSLDVEIRFRASSAGVRLQLPLRVPQNTLTKQHLCHNQTLRESAAFLTLSYSS